MTEIPEDIMKAARDLWSRMPAGSQFSEDECIEMIAAALLAERNRGAKIARQTQYHPASGHPDWEAACVGIEEAIMEGGEA